jgi:hypothetical protein
VVFDQQALATNNVQRFIDQHPSLFIAFFSVYCMALWCLVGVSISFIGGWFYLAKLYRRRVPFKGAIGTMPSGRMRWLTGYRHVLTIGASEERLYLGWASLFRFMHPPLLIPGGEIQVRRSKGWILDYVTFTMSRETAIRLGFLRGWPRRCRPAMDGLSRKYDSIPRVKYLFTVAHYFPVRLGTMILANKDGKTNARVAQGIA